MYRIFHIFEIVHCRKRLAIFLSPAGMSPTKLSLDGIIQLFLVRERVVSPPSRPSQLRCSYRENPRLFFTKIREKTLFWNKSAEVLHTVKSKCFFSSSIIKNDPFQLSLFNLSPSKPFISNPSLSNHFIVS
jgi:hypothetical protein